MGPLTAGASGTGKAQLGSGVAQVCTESGRRAGWDCGDSGSGLWCGEVGELGAGDKGVGELRRARVRV